MLLQALVTFAVEAPEADPNKTAFYILGGLLAVWAVVVSFVGLRAPSTFPGSAGGRAGVMAISTVLVLGAMAAAVLTA
jgi:hypothetical protein